MGSDRKERSQRISQAVANQAEAHHKFLKLSAFLATFLFPTLIGLILTFRDGLSNLHASVFWIPLAIFIGAQLIFGFLVVRSGTSVFGILVDYEKAEQELEDTTNKYHQADEELKFFSFLSQYAYHWSTQTQGWRASINADPGNLRDAMDDMFAAIFSEDESAFELWPRERLKFVLYIHIAGELIPVWVDEKTSGLRRVDSVPRTWPAGQGHVGITFSTSEDQITEDATTPDKIATFGAKRDLHRDSDEQRYKSFCSLLLSKDDTGFGVLVGTSNKVGRFTPEESALIVRQAATTVENMLSDANLEDIVANNRLP